MKRIIKTIKILAILVLCFQLLGITNNFSYAIDDIDVTEPTNELSSPNINIDLLPIISDPIVNINDFVNISFDNTDVLSYSIETEGLTAVEVSSGSMEYNITPIEEFGTLDLYATYADDIVIKSSVYTYLDDDTIYVSDVSQDQAWYDCMKLKYDNNEITLDEFQDSYYQLTSRYIEERTSDEGDSNETQPRRTVISGVLTWNPKNNVVAPLIKTKVELVKVINGSHTVCASDYTHIDGSFSFEFDDTEWSIYGEDVFVRIVLESETFRTTNNWVIESYSFDTDTKSVLQGSKKHLIIIFLMIPHQITIKQHIYIKQ